MRSSHPFLTIGFSAMLFASCNLVTELPATEIDRRMEKNNTATQTDGVTRREVQADATDEQTVRASSGAITGAAASFPPGSLAVSTEVTLEEGAAIAVPVTAEQLDLESGFEQTGAAVVVDATNRDAIIQPFTVAIPAPPSGGLHLTAPANDSLVVVTKTYSETEGRFLMGLILAKDLTVEDGFVKFQVKRLGVFQAAYLGKAPSAVASVETTAPIQTKAAELSLPQIVVTGRKPFVVRAGDVVELTGSNFRPTLLLAMGDSSITRIKLASDAQAFFVAPTADTSGSVVLSASQDGVTRKVTLFYTNALPDLPIITKPPQDVCSGERYYDQDGVERTGTKTCSAPDLSNLTPDNIKAGVTIAGVLGQYPSSAYPLAGASATADLDTATFAAKIKSNSQFEWWDAAGQRHAASGDADIASSNILSTVTIFGTTGSVTISGPDAADVRYGVVVGAMTGTLKTNCRNHATVSLFDNSNAPAGTSLDIWDTVDDYYAPIDDPWGDDRYTCDSANWVAGGLEAGFVNGPCNETSDECVYQDKLSGLSMTEVLGSTTWINAYTTCNDSTFGGHSDWRLPTQKELMQLYINGARFLQSVNFITNLSQDFLSATSVATTPAYIYRVNLATGQTRSPDDKTVGGPFFCVR